MLVKRYQGRVVQRMHRQGERIELIFPSATKGARRERLQITQRDWNRHGSETYEDGKSVDDFRTVTTSRVA